VKILHLEDSPSDAYLVQRTLSRHGLESQIVCAKSADEFRSALLGEMFDVIVVDNGLPGFDGRAALEFARQHRPDLPLIFCSGAARPEDALAKLDLGATDYVLKEHLWQLVAALRRLDTSTAGQGSNPARQYDQNTMSRDLRGQLAALDNDLAELRNGMGAAAMPDAQALIDSAQRHSQSLSLLIEELIRLAKHRQVADATAAAR
jgi:CheY-like chemotaxis protein